MVNTICIIAMALLSYFIAKEVKEQYPTFDIEPILYGIGAVFFGLIPVMVFLAGKYYFWQKKNK